MIARPLPKSKLGLLPMASIRIRSPRKCSFKRARCFSCLKAYLTQLNSDEYICFVNLTAGARFKGDPKTIALTTSIVSRIPNLMNTDSVLDTDNIVLAGPLRQSAPVGLFGNTPFLFEKAPPLIAAEVTRGPKKLALKVPI
jgi:hypothetical protein